MGLEILSKDYGIFVADFIYEMFAESMKSIFIMVYSDFVNDMGWLFESFFHLSVIGYAVLAFRGIIHHSIFQIFKTSAVSIGTFHSVKNMAFFKEWIYQFLFCFPQEVHRYLLLKMGDFLGTMDPIVLDPSSPLTPISQAFKKLFLIFWNITSDFNILTHTLGWLLSLGMMLVLIAIYFAFWVYAFNFLYQFCIMMMVSFPVFVTLGFNSTKHIFFEWLRGICTILLYPVFAGLIIDMYMFFVSYVYKDFLALERWDVLSVTTGIFLVMSLITLYALKQVPTLATILTRGTSTSNGSEGSIAGKFLKTTAVKAGAAAKAIGSKVGGGIASRYGKNDTSNTRDRAGEQGAVLPQSNMQALPALSTSIQLPPPSLRSGQIPDYTSNKGLLSSPSLRGENKPSSKFQQIDGANGRSKLLPSPGQTSDERSRPIALGGGIPEPFSGSPLNRGFKDSSNSLQSKPSSKGLLIEIKPNKSG